LVVMLISMVVLAIGLSVVSRSVTDVRISAQSQEAARAFWVAQGALEKAIRASAGGVGTTGDITYQVTKASLASRESFVFSDLVSANSPEVIWLVGHDGSGEIDSSEYYQGGSLDLYWGNEGTASDTETTPAMAATLVYQTITGTFNSRKYAFDPYAGREAKTNFSLPTVGNFEIDGKKLVFKGAVDFSGLPSFSKPYFLSLELFFSDISHLAGVQTSTGSPLPSQGNCYQSAATITASNIVRKLNECRQWDSPPEIFSYLLFSGGGLAK